MKKNILYALTCLSFNIIIGGAVYEHLNVVPRWTAGPPASLSMFQGPHGLKPELFWMIIHPVTILLFALTLVFHWRTGRRRHILAPFGIYIGILLITSVYFVPELISITTAAFSNTVDPGLTARAAVWEQLSLVRLCVLMILSVIIMLGIARPNAISDPAMRSWNIRRKPVSAA